MTLLVILIGEFQSAEIFTSSFVLLALSFLSHLSMQGLKQQTWVSVPFVVVSKEQKQGCRLLLDC